MSTVEKPTQLGQAVVEINFDAGGHTTTGGLPWRWAVSVVNPASTSEDDRNLERSSTAATEKRAHRRATAAARRLLLLQARLTHRAPGRFYVITAGDQT